MSTETCTVEPVLAQWLSEHLGRPGPWELRRLTGGNSNETCLLRNADSEFVLRKPPRHALSTSAHSVAREHRLLAALQDTAVPVPRVFALCEDPAVAAAPFLLMEHIPGAVAITDELPAAYRADSKALTAVADEIVDALAAIHLLDWRAAGLEGFGRPEGFLERQAQRWLRQWQKIGRRPLPAMPRLAAWLEDHRPETGRPALMHGDFHLDNCLFSAAEPRALAVIDWETATIGDPLMDLGLLLAFWGERELAHPGMPGVQGVSRAPGAPPREHLLDRYAQVTGTSLWRIDYYRCLALFKLAAITEAAHTQYLDGELRTEYAAALEHDVPALLAEACAIAGLSC